jgi:exosome complex RNA-binding protein Rrp42 (RNase PH superfamily)
VWSIRADVHVLSHDGNLVDASSIAVSKYLADVPCLVEKVGDFRGDDCYSRC